METLAEYLDRVMRQKNLTPTELAKRSQLNDNTINRFRRGVLNNPTVETILKLAKGLEVNAHEIFAVSSGIPVSETPPIDPRLFLDQMLKLIHHPRGLEVLQKWSQLPPEKQQQLFDLLVCLNQPPAKAKKKSRKK